MKMKLMAVHFFVVFALDEKENEDTTFLLLIL